MAQNNLQKELENYVWRKKRGGTNNEFVNEPIDAFNHLLDAMR